VKVKTIICPTDFSKNATQAAEYACAFGEQFHSVIILLHAYESPAVFTEAGFTVIRDAEAMIKEGAAKKIKALSQKLSKKFSNVKIETIIVHGPASENIISEANRNAADIIIMGTAGMNKMERLLMGSTTARVIRHAGCPVLCVPKEAAYNGIKNIVFATDLNEDNISSAMMLTPFAKYFDARVIFVFVDDKRLVHSDAEINKMAQKIRKHVMYPKISGFISKNTSISRGIEYFLEKNPADMLVMFSHQKHFPDTLFNQSITKILSYQTHIPLLSLNNSDRPVI
jgi:nucleotide-binding universal stress UspA family protein